jgi:pimeloyl-ACP methyl ester carboxylesterase
MQSDHRSITVDGHKLAAVCLNPGVAGEPIILLHGITSTTAFWQVNPAPYLLEAGPCYALSLPGHDPAVAPPDFKRRRLKPEDLVHLLYDAIDQLVGEGPVTLIGHSTGSFAALALAAAYPKLARRVVSVSGFAHGRWIGILGMYQRAVRLGWTGRAYFKVMYRFSGLRPATFRWAMRFYTADAKAMYAHPDLDEVIQRTYPSFQQLDLNAMTPYFRYMPQTDITDQLSHIRAKTLVVTGDRDSIVPPAQSHQIAQRIQGAELVTLEGAGYMPFLERSDAYHAQMAAWLAHTQGTIR